MTMVTRTQTPNLGNLDLNSTLPTPGPGQESATPVVPQQGDQYGKKDTSAKVVNGVMENAHVEAQQRSMQMNTAFEQGGYAEARHRVEGGEHVFEMRRPPEPGAAPDASEWSEAARWKEGSAAPSGAVDNWMHQNGYNTRNVKFVEPVDADHIDEVAATYEGFGNVDMPVENASGTVNVDQARFAYFDPAGNGIVERGNTQFRMQLGESQSGLNVSDTAGNDRIFTRYEGAKTNIRLSEGQDYGFAQGSNGESSFSQGLSIEKEKHQGFLGIMSGTGNISTGEGSQNSRVYGANANATITNRGQGDEVWTGQGNYTRKNAGKQTLYFQDVDAKDGQTDLLDNDDIEGLDDLSTFRIVKDGFGEREKPRYYRTEKSFFGLGSDNVETESAHPNSLSVDGKAPGALTTGEKIGIGVGVLALFGILGAVIANNSGGGGGGYHDDYYY